MATRAPSTEFLTDWDLLAIEQAVAQAVESGRLDARCGKALHEKLVAASHVRLSYYTRKAAA